jgi:hypothetical protein
VGERSPLGRLNSRSDKKHVNAADGIIRRGGGYHDHHRCFSASPPHPMRPVLVELPGQKTPAIPIEIQPRPVVSTTRLEQEK